MKDKTSKGKKYVFMHNFRWDFASGICLHIHICICLLFLDVSLCWIVGTFWGSWGKSRKSIFKCWLLTLQKKEEEGFVIQTIVTFTYSSHRIFFLDKTMSHQDKLLTWLNHRLLKLNAVFWMGKAISDSTTIVFDTSVDRNKITGYISSHRQNRFV